jgi:hypothetical protein
LRDHSADPRLIFIASKMLLFFIQGVRFAVALGRDAEELLSSSR